MKRPSTVMQKTRSIPTVLSAAAPATKSDARRSLGLPYFAIFTVLATYGLIVLGGTVRATNSGTACPDWPLCYGEVIPRMEYHVLIEWSHRLVASIVGFLILTLAVWTWRVRRESGVRVVAAAAIVFLVVQVLLGAVTVNTETDATIVALHLSVALTLFAFLVLLMVMVMGKPQAATAPPWSAILTMASLFALIIVGAYVSQEGAGLVYPDWPLFDGKLLSAGGKLADLHYAHRLLAVLVGVILMVFAHSAARKHRSGVLVAALSLAGLLYVAQVLVGASNIWFELATSVRIVHLALASALWGVLVFSVAWLARSPNSGTEAA